VKNHLWTFAICLGVLASGVIFTRTASAAVCQIANTDPSAKSIGQSCDAILDTMDAFESNQRASKICCESANDYLKKHPIPPAEHAKTSYRIKLALSACDSIKDPALQYERDYCLNQMLYHIPDPKVLEIADRCSPTGGRAVGGGHHGGGPGGGNGKTETPASSADNKTVAEKKDHSSDHPRGSGAPNQSGAANVPGSPSATAALDPHLDDEAYSKCQRKSLARYVEKLDSEN
jgi:hypothetical protein